MRSTAHQFSVSGHSDQRPPGDDKVRDIIFWDGVSTFFKITGMLVWFIIFVLTLLELKRYFDVDIFPGYDGAIDDAYNSLRDSFSR